MAEKKHNNAVVVTCIDPRLHQRKDGRNFIGQFIFQFVKRDSYLVANAGGVQKLFSLIRNDFEGRNSNPILYNLEIAIGKVNEPIIYLVNHEDCKAYGKYNLENREAEIEKHRQDLKDAKVVILKYYPDAKIKMFFAKLIRPSNDNFTFIEVK